VGGGGKGPGDSGPRIGAAIVVDHSATVVLPDQLRILHRAAPLGG
jgi:hypothetical protein